MNLLQNEKIKNILFDQALKDPNALGELLLSYAFVGEGRGCYSNFKLRDSFVEVINKDEIHSLIYGENCLDFSTPQEIKEEKEQIKQYTCKETNLSVGWIWDGDGHLVFKFKDIILENNDIKKDYTWRFIN